VVSVSDEGIVFPGTEDVLRRPASVAETSRANRSWWDWHAADYAVEHASELPPVSFVWSPEGAREDDLGLLGDVRGRSVLEVGCGAAQCSRWLARHGARPVAFDLSGAMLAEGRRLGAGSGVEVPLVQADATSLPFRDESFDLACSAYGAVPFVADSAAVMREVARVLRPGGRWVFSVTHPVRWVFPDDAGPSGLTVSQSYFDRTPYVETRADGTATYVEHHRTMGDRVRELVAAGLAVVDLLEPPWPEGHVTTYAQWGGLRGELLPGTAIWVTEKRE
jgi:SAM-dependent methyltransferase